MTQKVLRISEKFDFSCHKNFNAQSDQLLKDPEVTVIVLDFSTVHYLDSAALGMVIYLQKKAKAVQRKVVIQHAHGTARDILKVANIDQFIEIHD